METNKLPKIKLKINLLVCFLFLIVYVYLRKNRAVDQVIFPSFLKVHDNFMISSCISHKDVRSIQLIILAYNSVWQIKTCEQMKEVYKRVRSCDAVTPSSHDCKIFIWDYTRLQMNILRNGGRTAIYCRNSFAISCWNTQFWTI